MKFSEKIKNLRQNAGLTQQELAKHLGITASAIGFLENEKREPTGSTLIAYARHFDIPIDELVGLSPDLEDHFSAPKEVIFMDLKSWRKIKKERGMTYQDIADRSGLPVGTIKNIFAGYTPDPRQSTISAIELALGVDTKLPPIPYLTPEEEQLIQDFRALSPALREMLQATIRTWKGVAANDVGAGKRKA